MRYFKVWNIGLVGVILGVIPMSAAHAAALLKPTSGPIQTLRPRALDISTHIDGAWARSTVTTIFARRSKQNIEADLIMSVPEGAVVTGFAYYFGNERVEARVTEKERAATIETAVAPPEKEEEIDPAWAPLVGKNGFQARLHAIKPGRDLRVELQLAQPLQNEGATSVWQYPLTSDARDVTLDWLRLRASAPDNSRARNNYGAQVSGDELSVKKYNFKPKTDLRVAFSRPKGGLSVQISSEHPGANENEAYFALDLCAPGETKVLPTISGVETFEVLPPQRISPGEIRVFGRYRGHGAATVSWGKREAIVWFAPATDAENEISGLAAPLWGASKLALLKGVKNARLAEITLSKRFNIVSDSTSWVAIPAAQRKIIEAQLQRADLNARGAKWSRNWAIEIENQRPLSAKALEARAQLRQMVRSSVGRKYDFDEENARGQAIKTRIGELARLVMARRMNIAAQDPKAAAKMQVLARFSEQNPSPFLQKAQYGLRARQVEALKKRWTTEVVALRGQTPGAARLKNQLETLQNRYGMESDFESNAYRLAARQMAFSALDEALAGRENSPRATLLIDAGERFVRRCGENSFHRAFYEPALDQTLHKAQEEYLGEIEAGRDQSDDALGAGTQLRQIYTLAPQLRGSLRDEGSLEWEIDAARRGLAHETAYRIAQTRAERPDDTRTIRELQAQLERVAAKTEDEPDDYLAAETRRLQKGQPLLSAHQFRLQESGQSTDDDEQNAPTRGEPNLTSRGGDPLLSLVLPRDVRYVEAIGANGEARNLSWNDLSGAWETRFYAPHFASGGRLSIALRVVDASGRSTRILLNLAFPKLAAPEKTAGSSEIELSESAPSWQIGIWVPRGTQRVSAILPWRDRVALPCLPSGQFAAPVGVPPSWRDKKPRIGFLITDKTAQTNLIRVDWN